MSILIDKPNLEQKKLDICVIMKLIQFHSFTPVIFEVTDISLKVRQKKILKKETEEFLFENILIKDIYELKHNNRYALGYIFVCVSFFVHSGIGLALNPKHAEWMSTAISGAITFAFIIRYYIPATKIFIPTKKQGLIRLYKNRPSKKKVQEFIYILEGKVNLSTKKKPEKEDLNQFLMG